MIVLAIITMVMAMAIPALDRVTYQRLNSTTRTFVGLARTIRDNSILLNNIYRLSVDLDKNTYWVEEQKEFKLLTAQDNPAPKKGKTLKEEPASNFSLSSKFFKKPQKLPNGVIFDGVLKEREGLRKDGVVYVHFFPNGFSEQAILYLKRDGSTASGYSIIIYPNGGRVEVFPGVVNSFGGTP